MKAWPMRGGCCRKQLIGGMLILGLLVACSGDEASGSAVYIVDIPDAETHNDGAFSGGAYSGEALSGESQRSGETAELVQPAICGTGAVISAEAADTGTPKDVLDMQAYLLVNPPDNPPGYRTQSVVVDGGLGSFRVTLPQSYLPVWRYGTPGRDLLDMAEVRDPDWTKFWGRTIAARGINHRAISLDADVSDQVVAVLITFTDLEDEGDRLAEALGTFYSDGGGMLAEACGVRANGADGAYIEHTVPGELIGSPVDRTQLQFLIPDKPNRALWGVTCDVPRSVVTTQHKQTCREIASLFRPLPEVEYE